MKKLITLIFIVLIFHSTKQAHANSGWSGWQAIGDGISISSQQVDANQFTWRIRNDMCTTINYLALNYQDADGYHSYVMPGDLPPGKSFGAWLMITHGKVTMTIKSIAREKDPKCDTSQPPPDEEQ